MSREEVNVEAISGAARYFDEVALIPSDSRTTITANVKGQAAYAKFQVVKMRRDAGKLKWKTKKKNM